MNARLALILLFGFVAFINCADIYLSPFGSDSNSGSSTSSPLKSFNQALQIASSGDVIYAMPGLYSGTLNSDITISKSVTITSTEGPDSTIVIGPGGWDVRTQCTISDLQFVSFTDGEVFYVYLTTKYTDTAVTFNNVIFYENDWAIYFYDYYYANTHAIYNCNFTANTQAVLFNQYYSYSTLNVENCTFDNNTRAINGLFNELSVSNSYFSQMSCTAPGCAISVNASTSTAITGNIFSECVSSSNGGAIYIAKGTSGTTISSCKFISNSGVSGGAIYSLGSVDIVSSIFQTNTATVGGSLYLLGSTSTSVGSSIADTSFLLNSATDSAGAVYCQSSSISFQDVDFYSNKAPVGSSYQCGSGCYTFEIDVKSQNNSPDCSTTV